MSDVKTLSQSLVKNKFLIFSIHSIFKFYFKNKNNKLFFAGEATTTYIGTVHGGYMTGINVANTLYGLIKKK